MFLKSLDPSDSKESNDLTYSSIDVTFSEIWVRFPVSFGDSPFPMAPISNCFIVVDKRQL